jgi:hypothetical protein
LQSARDRADEARKGIEERLTRARERFEERRTEGDDR